MLVGILLLSTALPVPASRSWPCSAASHSLGWSSRPAVAGDSNSPSDRRSRSPFPALLARSEVGAVSATVALLVGVAAVAGAVGTVALLGVHEPAGHATLGVEHAAENDSVTDAPVTADTPLVVTVGNRRPAATTYTLVALVERLAPDERWTKRYRLEDADVPARLAFELHRGSDSPGDGAADTRVHLWLTAAGNASSAESVASKRGTAPLPDQAGSARRAEAVTGPADGGVTGP
ncbi:hypothetical protein BRC60_05365 [Halobacteriales archaeon QH_1_68_42]|nr:MAG: hypothetical protein BRC60_05365 [Halobacteriales archaeon QH_1_68_42]